MSGIIKADAASGTVRRFAPVAYPPALASARETPGSAARAKLEAEKTALVREVDEMKLALAEADKKRGETEQRAKAEGHAEGLKAAEAAEAERLAALEAALAEMTSAWNERLQGLDELAARIARTALSKLFDSWEDAAEFVTRSIARQVRLMRRETIMAIRVSRDDFPDEAALADLAARAKTGSVRILADADLSPGECRADLQLGHLDLGLRSQRKEVTRLLDSLADGAEGAR
jgi:flagellar assembly protein FliH